MNISPDSIHRWLRSGVLLAISGGADSVALLRIFVEFYQTQSESIQNPRLAVAHVNHGLRDRESDQDALFVRELAAKFELPYFEHTIRPDAWNADESGSFESAARSLRYDFLLETAQRNGLRHIATAHTKNDQIETVVHRIVRGTGIAGLAGIPRVRKINEAVSLIRPLLSIFRTEIEEYLDQIGQPFRIDSSNASPQFTRNRIRLELLPHLKENYNPAVEDALERLSQLAAEAQEILDEETERIWNEIRISQSENEVVLNYLPLLAHKPFRVREFFVYVWKEQNWPMRHLGFAQFDAIDAMLRNAKPPRIDKRMLPGAVEIRVDPNQGTVHIVFSEKNQPVSPISVPFME